MGHITHFSLDKPWPAVYLCHMSVRPLTPKRKAFIREYLVDHNGTQAAIRAGYSPRTADVAAAKDLLPNPKIRAEIAKAEARISARYEITAERIKAELAKVAFSNMEDYVMHENGDITPHLTNCTRDQMAAVQEFTVDSTGGTGDGERRLVLRTRFRLADKTRALELLAKCKDTDCFVNSRVELTASDDILDAIAEGRRRVAKCRKR